MAPTFRHGQSAIVLWNGDNLSPFLDAATISASMDAAEVTNFASACNREYIGGLKDVTLALEGFYSVATTAPSTAINDVLDAVFTGTSSPIVTIGPEDDVIGRRAWLFKGDIVTYDIDNPVDDAIATSVDLQGSQGYYGGRWLRGLSQTTAADTAVDSGLTNGGTTGGGVAHLHVTSINSTGSCTFVVQHSTSGSTWATLITFAAVTAAKALRSTVAGTVKEQLRVDNTAQGSTANVFTAAVAFARYGPSKA